MSLDQAVVGGLGAASAINSAMQNKDAAETAEQQTAQAQAAQAARQALIDNPGAPQYTMNRQRLTPTVGTGYGFGPQAQFFNNSIPTPIPKARGGLSSTSQGRQKQSGALRQVRGPGGGQDDQIPALLSDGEYVMDADVVAALGDGSNEKGAQKLDQMREKVREHKRAAPAHKIPPKAKRPEQYLRRKS